MAPTLTSAKVHNLQKTRTGREYLDRLRNMATTYRKSTGTWSSRHPALLKAAAKPCPDKHTTHQRSSKSVPRHVPVPDFDSTAPAAAAATTAVIDWHNLPSPYSAAPLPPSENYTHSGNYSYSGSQLTPAALTGMLVAFLIVFVLPVAAMLLWLRYEAHREESRATYIDRVYTVVVPSDDDDVEQSLLPSSPVDGQAEVEESEVLTARVARWIGWTRDGRLRLDEKAAPNWPTAEEEKAWGGA